MSDPIRVFVNAAPVAVPPGATVLDAVRAWNAEEAERIRTGTRTATDSRGLPVELDRPLQAGSILRTVSARGAAGEADAEPT